jgi:23S rRNA pseudouridine2457 synthase
MSHQHFKLYKPTGYLSQFVNNQNKRRKKKLLGELGKFPIETMSVGRLDEKSEGLLFLTTNGKLSNEVCSTSIEKEYYVQLDGEITSEATAALENGVDIILNKKKYTTLPAKAFILNPDPIVAPSSREKRDLGRSTSWVSITIKEGKYRQVRKMTAAVGFPTLRLIRVRIGNEKIEGLAPGECVEVDGFSL